MTIIKYQYKDPKEMTAFKVINEGEGYFKILEIKSQISKKSGNEMLVFTFQLRDTSGNQTLYNMFLVFNEYMADNIWRICEAIGRTDLYKESGTNTEDLLGTAGKCKIKTEDTDYGKQSKIHRFIPYKPMQESAAVEVMPPMEDDSIPF